MLSRPLPCGADRDRNARRRGVVAECPWVTKRRGSPALRSVVLSAAPKGELWPKESEAPRGEDGGLDRAHARPSQARNAFCRNPLPSTVETISYYVGMGDARAARFLLLGNRRGSQEADGRPLTAVVTGRDPTGPAVCPRGPARPRTAHFVPGAALWARTPRRPRVSLPPRESGVTSGAIQYGASMPRPDASPPFPTRRT